MSGHARREMLRSFRNITHDPPPGISARLPDPDDPTRWTVIMKGPKHSPYENATFKLDFIHRDRFLPPKVKFIGRVPMHPNIDEDGTICLNILGDDYSPALLGETILVSIHALLSSPNPYECVRTVLGILLLEDPATYDTVIRMHCQGEELLFDELINEKKLNSE